MSKINKPQLTHWILLNLVIAIAYIIAVGFSNQFTTLEGEIPSVWFPAAISLAMVFIYGNQVFVGIILGAIIGFSLIFNPLSSSLSFISFFLLCLTSSGANFVQPLITTYLIKKYSKYQINIFAHLHSVWVFIVASMFSPLISAFMVVTMLYLTKTIEINQYPLSFCTWWLASVVAHLIFTPALIIYREEDNLDITGSTGEILLVSFLLYFLCLLVFEYNYSLEYLYLLILIWGVLRLSRFYSSLLIIIVALINILMTNQGYGVFIKDSVNESLLFLQSFVAIFSITTLILMAIFSEKQQHQLSLIETLDTLEIKVYQRTKELEQTQLYLQTVNQGLAQMVNTDSLTKIANRRCFDEQLLREWTRLYRTQKFLSLLMLDVDYFKSYNDTYGHQLGDKCLTEIAQVLKISSMRSSDLVARYGGEEFTILLPNTTIEGAIAVAKRVQENLSSLGLAHENSPISDSVTVSIGISSLIPIVSQSPKILVDQADQALYRAKNNGRNQYQVVVIDHNL